MCCCGPQGGVGAAADESDSSSVEGEQYRHPFVDGHDQVSAFLIPAGSGDQKVWGFYRYPSLLLYLFSFSLFGSSH